ncbi:MAG TPA: hypothetical protein VG077_02390 [Verrucomicrobiae bacterium]|nr:hypothetical protein [Verrucomicrobiae bacterium]
MKGFSHFLKSGLLALAMIIACLRVGAQGFGLSVFPSANPILVNNSLTYTINVTNLTGGDLTDAVVTNVLPASVQILSVTNSQGFYLVTNNTVLFDLGAFYVIYPALLTVTVRPTAVGSITDLVTVASGYTTNTASTNVVVQVTNAVVQADLGVTIAGPSQPVVTNDLMTYGVTVTNLGPNTASDVMLTNTLPPGVIAISPANQTTFNLGSLTNGGFASLQFTVEPTNAGVLPFTASVGSSAVQDVNITNNTATTNITVSNYLSGPLAVTTNSGLIYNAQNGLVEQSITVTNNTNYVATAVRVVVAGLTSTNWLFNAVGTNSGNPFVDYSTNLVAGQSVSLLLQYAANAYFPFTNGQLQAFAVPLPNWTPPASTRGTNVISRIVELTNGNMLIEWPSTAGRTYTVVYSDNVLFSNAMIAPPSIVAPASRTQWIDYGPPTTVSAPANASARFYRVLQNP